MTPLTVPQFAQRRLQILRGLITAQERLERACEQADRDPAEVNLIVATKDHPVTDVAILAELGVRQVAESRHQQAQAKYLAYQEWDLPPLVWHFIGQIQRNKAAAVARYCDLIQSVDRVSVVPVLAHAGTQRRQPVDILLQVKLDSTQTRQGGVNVHEFEALVHSCLESEGVAIRGVMAISPPRSDPRKAFSQLRHCAAQLRARAPQAAIISAGMSGDLEAAVICGATHVRLGSVVLGPRAVVD